MAKNNIMSLGNTNRITMKFKLSSTGELTNPSSVSVKILDPDGATTTNTATNLSTGVYYYDFTPTIAGKHTVRCYSTGSIAASDEIFIAVQGQLVP